MALQPTRRRFTVAEYHRMAEAGILGEDDRLELIDGEIIEMTPIGRRHAGAVDRLTELFVKKYSDVALVRVQNPVQLDEYTEPQPDLALLHRQSDFYTSGHPTPADVFLLVEVAETSAAYDRRLKIPLYGRSGIPEVWLVDLEQQCVTVHRDPTARGYRSTRVLRRGELLAPAAFPDRPSDVGDILG